MATKISVSYHNPAHTGFFEAGYRAQVVLFTATPRVRIFFSGIGEC